MKVLRTGSSNQPRRRVRGDAVDEDVEPVLAQAVAEPLCGGLRVVAPVTHAADDRKAALPRLDRELGGGEHVPHHERPAEVGVRPVAAVVRQCELAARELPDGEHPLELRAQLGRRRRVGDPLRDRRGAVHHLEVPADRLAVVGKCVEQPAAATTAAPATRRTTSAVSSREPSRAQETPPPAARPRATPASRCARPASRGDPQAAGASSPRPRRRRRSAPALEPDEPSSPTRRAPAIAPASTPAGISRRGMSPQSARRAEERRAPARRAARPARSPSRRAANRAMTRCTRSSGRSRSAASATTPPMLCVTRCTRGASSSAMAPARRRALRARSCIAE